uniref:Uncharacterized protein n=1 Tax=Heterorhabditis bacteriophora TaxID=37862 RepID=A0A1I7X6L6_HETBA
MTTSEIHYSFGIIILDLNNMNPFDEDAEHHTQSVNMINREANVFISVAFEHVNSRELNGPEHRR